MKSLILITLILTFLSCEGKDEVKIKRKQIKDQKEKLASDLTEKYSIKYDLDTLRFEYTILFDKVIQTQYQLISDLTINDFYHKNGSNFIKIGTGNFPYYYLNLEVSNKMKTKILPLLDLKHYERRRTFSEKLILVIKLKKMHKLDWAFESIDDEEYSYIELDHSSNFIGNGELVEIHIIE